MMIEPPDTFAKDRKAEREGILPKSRRAVLIILTIVLLLTLAGIALFLTAGH